jgi:GNAT superfamily N-acetyltransferase
MTRIVAVKEEVLLQQVKALFISYGNWRNHDTALGDFQQELDQLPGKYAFPDGALFLALAGAEPAGCIAYQALGSGICEMKRMYVLEKFRNKGIGRGLVETLISAARKAGYQYMRLDTHPKMIQAHKLYQAMGFYEIERYNQNPTPGIRFFERKLT